MDASSPPESSESFHSAQSSLRAESCESTQPFPEISQPGTDLEQLIPFLADQLEASSSSKPSSPIDVDTALVRVFARSLIHHQCFMTITTFPDGVPATVLDHGILAVSQSTRSTGCDIVAPTFHIRLWFNPFQDTLTAFNLSQRQILTFHSKSQGSQRLGSGNSVDLQLGYWILASPGVGGQPPQEWLDMVFQPRQFQPVSNSIAEVTGTKRLRKQVEDSNKHKKTPDGRHTRAPEAGSTSLLQIANGGTVSMSGPRRNDKYSVTSRGRIASTPASSLYKADYSLRPGQVVAVKAYKPTSQAHYFSTTTWHNEVLAYERIGQHPCIPRLFGSDARSLTLYMEYIDATSLATRQTSGMCDCSDRVFVILSDITSALQSIHASGLVHNDIKPSNILYHNTRGAILTDFGLATTPSENSGASPWYLPPEYLQTVRTQDRRGPLGDVFALGVTILWVLRKCPLPELVQEAWKMADIWALDLDRRSQAQGRMRAWLRKIEKFQLDLGEDGSSIDSIVRCMLAERRTRITVDQIIDRLELVSLE